MFLRWSRIAGLIETGRALARAWLPTSVTYLYDGSGGATTGGTATIVAELQPVIYEYEGSGGVTTGGAAQVVFATVPLQPPIEWVGRPFKLTVPMFRGRTYQYVGRGGVVTGGAADVVVASVPLLVESVVHAGGLALVSAAHALVAQPQPARASGFALASVACAYASVARPRRFAGMADVSRDLDIRMAEDDALEMAMLLGPDWIDHPALDAVAELCR